jgi:hypothetical protein
LNFNVVWIDDVLCVFFCFFLLFFFLFCVFFWCVFCVCVCFFLSLSCVCWCPTQIVLCFCFVLFVFVLYFVLPNVASFSGLSILDQYFCLFNVYLRYHIQINMVIYRFSFSCPWVTIFLHSKRVKWVVKIFNLTLWRRICFSHYLTQALFQNPSKLPIWQHAGKGTRHFNPREDYRLFHHWFSGVKTP